MAAEAGEHLRSLELGEDSVRGHISARLVLAAVTAAATAVKGTGGSSAPGKVERNVRKLAAAVGLPEDPEKWLTMTD